jgi:glutathione S-transferase
MTMGVRFQNRSRLILYLAKRYGSGAAASLYPATLQGEADAWRWTLWVQGHIEPWVQRDVHLATLREAAAECTPSVIRAALVVLERALAERDWLVEGRFTIADLNVAAVLSPTRSSQLELSEFMRVSAWLARCYARPAAMATRARYM